MSCKGVDLLNPRFNITVDHIADALQAPILVMYAIGQRFCAGSNRTARRRRFGIDRQLLPRIPKLIEPCPHRGILRFVIELFQHIDVGIACFPIPLLIGLGDNPLIQQLVAQAGNGADSNALSDLTGSFSP